MSLFKLQQAYFVILLDFKFFTNPHLEYAPFIGFSMIHESRSNESFAGYNIHAPPELFIDLADPSRPISSVQHIIELLALTVKRCELLRAKMSIIPGILVMHRRKLEVLFHLIILGSLALYQTSSLISHLFASLIPFPNLDDGMGLLGVFIN